MSDVFFGIAFCRFFLLSSKLRRLTTNIFVYSQGIRNEGERNVFVFFDESSVYSCFSNHYRHNLGVHNSNMWRL